MYAKVIKRRLPIFVIVFCIFANFLSAQTTLEGTVTKVRDGDTIEVGKIPVRFQGLTCDELDTKKGQKARDLLTNLLIGERIICELSGEITYERLVGRCFLSDKGDIASHLIEIGYCGRCNRYDEKGFYTEVQRKAGSYRGVFPSYCN